METTEQKQQKLFSLTQLVSAYNQYYHNIDDTPKIHFKIWKEGVKAKEIINIDDYEGIKELEKEYVERQSEGIDEEIVTEESQSEDKKTKTKIEKRVKRSTDDYISILAEDFIYEPIIRGALTLASNFKLHPKQQKGGEPPQNMIYHGLISRLGFKEAKTENYGDFIKTIIDFIDSPKLKIKIFNKLYPKVYREVSGDTKKSVDAIHLQHINKHFKVVIDSFNNGKNLEEILKNVAAAVAADFGDKPGDRGQQALDPKLIEYILNGFPTKESKGKQIVDSKWAEKMDMFGVNKSGKGVYNKNRPVAEDRLEVINVCIKELTLVKNFVQNLQKRLENSNVDEMKKITEEFYRQVDAIDKFVNEHSNDSKTVTGFIKLLIAATRFLSTELNIQTSFKLIANELSEIHNIRFNKVIKKKIDDNLKEDDPAALEEFCTWIENNPVSFGTNRNCDFRNPDMEIYSQVGKYVNIDQPLSKKYRIVCGAAIVYYINNELRVILARNEKKKDIVVYLKTTKENTTTRPQSA